MSPAGSPLFSIITPVFDTDPVQLREMVDSVLAQRSADWELLLVDDCSTSAETIEALTAVQDLDPRITVIRRSTNGRISAATNTGLESAAGTFVVLVDHDDALSPAALAVAADAIAADETVDYLYSDEDKIDEEGALSGTFAKPTWSPARLLSQMYTSHVSIIRTTLLREVGGFRSEYDGSQDHDAILRVTERARNITHLGEVLYHWRATAGSTAIDVREKDYAWDAGLRAVSDAVRRRQLAGVAEPGHLPGTYRVVWSVPAAVSLVLCIDDDTDAQRAAGAVHALATGVDTDVELVVVHGPAVSEAALQRLDETPTSRRVLVPAPVDAPSAARNIGFSHSTSDVVVFVDTMLESVADDSLANLTGPLSQPDVGAVGARLLDTSGRILHAGFRYARGDYRRPYSGRDADAAGEANALVVDREVSAVSAMLVAVDRMGFESVGGWNEALSGETADLDLGWKFATLGRRVLWSASAEAVVDRELEDAGTADEQVTGLFARWGDPTDDPYIP
ncbi:MAG TPA: glycosyltransferase [Plantibacter sp.]|uniref:glycosyltransferase n=1 Tax=unclassified Plantibacter TaxID=2624265 RepID=UPI002CF12F94|nr:glycosyltransferase [Plantibacter sp.]